MKQKNSIHLGMALLLIVASAAMGAESEKKEHASMDTKENRAKMAQMHEKMAACLKSDKPLKDCKEEMMKGCKDMMGGEGCPMMHDMHGMHGHGRHHEGGAKED